LEIGPTEFRRNLPYQLIPGEKTTNFLTTTANLEEALNYFVYVKFAISLILSASLSQLWSLMNCLQLTLHLSAMNIKIPPNTTYFSSKLLSVVQFDFIP
jgi:hypothetical protein